MTLNRIARWLALAVVTGGGWLAFSAPAEAIPVFARQTGHNCQACHISYPELTAYGREFKLNGYTFGEAQPIPLAGAIMAEVDHVRSTDASTGAPTCAGTGLNGTGNCDVLRLNQYSIFFGGRFSDNFGMFGQMTGTEFPIGAGSGTGNSHVAPGGWAPAADNTEFRYVHRIAADDSLEPAAVLGLNMNNNPAMEDVWNSVPAWRFPWFPYFPAGHGPVAATYIDNPSGGHDKVGIGAYAWVQKSFYAEVNLYHSATGMLSFMNWGQGGTEANMATPLGVNFVPDVLSGENPYWRLAYSHDWGYNSVEVGLFGWFAKTYNCNPAAGATCVVPYSTATNNYHDTAIDAQYQFNKGDPWVFGASGSYIHENNDLTALYQSSGGTAVSQPGHSVNEFNVRGTVYYNRQWGATLGYSSLNGTSDMALYGSGTDGGSLTGDPSSSWWTLELNYLPLQNLRFSLLFQQFKKINGGTSDFDGFGNSAGGQDRITGAIWWAF